MWKTLVCTRLTNIYKCSLVEREGIFAFMKQCLNKFKQSCMLVYKDLIFKQDMTSFFIYFEACWWDCQKF